MVVVLDQKYFSFHMCHLNSYQKSGISQEPLERYSSDPRLCLRPFSPRACAILTPDKYDDLSINSDKRLDINHIREFPCLGHVGIPRLRGHIRYEHLMYHHSKCAVIIYLFHV